MGRNNCRVKIFVLGAAVLWGTAGTAGLLVSGAEPMSIAAVRLVVGGAVLAMIAGTAMRGLPQRRLLGAGALAVVGYQLCYFAAIGKTGVAIGTVVTMGSSPMFTGLLTWLRDRRTPSKRWSAATASAIIGCGLLTGGGSRAHPSGILLALLAGLLYAFYVVTAARVIDSGAPSDAVMGALFGGAALAMFPILLFAHPAWLFDPAGALVALYLGCFTIAAAYILYGRGLRTTPVANAATLALADPAVAALLGIVILGERLTPVSVSGLLLLGAGLVVVALPRRGRPIPRPHNERLDRQPARHRRPVHSSPVRVPLEELLV